MYAIIHICELMENIFGYASGSRGLFHKWVLHVSIYFRVYTRPHEVLPPRQSIRYIHISYIFLLTQIRRTRGCSLIHTFRVYHILHIPSNYTYIIYIYIPKTSTNNKPRRVLTTSRVCIFPQIYIQRRE
jgi:hypothetical protein